MKIHSSELQNIAVPGNGYVYIYVSNESPVNVFFDNLQGVHNRGAILEETHYYPFGLAMAGISSRAAGGVENKRRFNDGTELESKEFSDGSGLDLYATEFRSYDPQIGRFHQIDALTELNVDFSGYVFANNNPILYNDPWGLDTLKRNADGSLPTIKPDGSKVQENDIVLNGDGPISYYNGEGWKDEKVLETVVVTNAPKKKDESPTSSNQSNTTNQQQAPNNDRGQNEADIARRYPGRDMRIYSMTNIPNTIDCSRFTREVAQQAGYNIPRVAFDQARWYQQHGRWETNVNNAQPGDHIFWLRGTNAYHTGVVIDNIMATNGARIIRVVQAQVNHYRPGSVQLQRLMANGQMRGFGQPFVGLGRYP